MFRTLAVVLSLAKRLDVRLTSGVGMHGRYLTGLNRARPARRAAQRRRSAPKHWPTTFATH
jgi:hypothetical protein